MKRLEWIYRRSDVVPIGPLKLSSRLFPSDDDLRMSHMADAYAYRSLWDLRWYSLKLYLYTTIAALTSIFTTSLIEYYLGYSLFAWLLGL